MRSWPEAHRHEHHHLARGEVQCPLVTVVIGGLITATALTLLVLSAIARLVMHRDEDQRDWRRK